jgi:hypothetical protein
MQNRPDLLAGNRKTNRIFRCGILIAPQQIIAGAKGWLQEHAGYMSSSP